MPRPEIKHNPVMAYVPVSFPNIDELVKGTGLSADRMRCFCHQLFMQRLKDSSNDRITKTDKYKEGWVSLSSDKLKKLNASYKKYVDLLELKGELFVRRNPHTGKPKYARNGSSAQYKIDEKYLHKEGSIRHYRKEYITDHTTLSAIKKVKESNRTEPPDRKHVPLEAIHEKLFDMVSMVRFDIVKAESFLTKVSQGEIKVRQTKSGIERNYKDLLLLLDAINEGAIMRCNVDKYGQRLHTSVSNLWKDLRPFMYFKGLEHKQLVVLDFANSQPYFSSIAINANLIVEILPEFAACVPKIEAFTKKPDFKRFADLCARGKIYEHWKSIRRLKDRDAAKQEIFLLMFGKNSSHYPAKAIFKQFFPSVFKCFAEIKSLTELDLPFIKDVYMTQTGTFEGRKSLHKNLSCMMQRMESRIVLCRIAPKLITEGLVPFVTVHDSFIIPAEYEQKARAIINAEFNSLGVTPPTIKTEIF
ncbi:MAG: hypothetical protein ACLQQ4_16055 [Bacteroidia bacterium]